MFAGPSEDGGRHGNRFQLSTEYYLSKAARPPLQPGSTIITTASIQTYHPSPQLPAYVSIKGALDTFSIALAQEGAEKRIWVNVVAPGPV